MTEAEWNACTDPAPMLAFLQNEGKASRRKLRLFAVACCRKMAHVMSDESLRRPLDVAERFAEGKATDEELFSAYQEAARNARVIRAKGAWAVVSVASTGPFNAARGVAHATRSVTLHANRGLEPHVWHSTPGMSHDEQAALLRDIFPFPDGPALDPAWLSGAVPSLARVIYDERAFNRMPVLADALEDAGCHDERILGHCRASGGHVRGCWVIDLLLGRE